MDCTIPVSLNDTIVGIDAVYDYLEGDRGEKFQVPNLKHQINSKKRKSMNFPENLKYTKDHEWIRIEGNVGTIGITDHAQSELGDVVFVELPSKGKKVKQGESFGTIEAVKAVSDLYAPVSGEVVEFNADLEKNSEIVNKEPYEGGWMVKLKLSDASEVGGLLDVGKYRELIGK